MLIAFTYPLLILIFNLMNGIATNFSQLSMFSGIIGFLFEIMIKVAYPFIMVIILWIAFLAIRDANLKKLMSENKRRLIG